MLRAGALASSLPALMPRSEKFSCDGLRGVELHLLHWGDDDRPELILLHGGGANAHWWDHMAPLLAKEYHVVALDFRGHGDSDHPEELKVGAFSDDLEALLEHLGSANAALVGHSMGAHVALDHAARHSETRALVLIDLSRGASRRSRRSARLALSLRRTYHSRSEAVARFRFLPPSEHASEALRESIARHSVREESGERFGFKFDPRWFGLPARPRPDLSAVRCPTLLVRGAESALLTREGAESLAVEIGSSTLVEIAGAGHHVHLDRPDALLREMIRFLAGTR